MDNTKTSVPNENCPKCGEPLTGVVTTASGKKLQRCTAGTWDPSTRQTQGCDFVKWMAVEPVTLEEKCPKCGANLVLAVTRYGKKMKKCSTSGWDKTTRQPTGCPHVEWITGTSLPLDEKCPDCGESLVLYTTAAGKKMKKCSTSGWDKTTRQPTGCTYVYWFKPGEYTGNETEQQPPPSQS